MVKILHLIWEVAYRLTWWARRTEETVIIVCLGTELMVLLEMEMNVLLMVTINLQNLSSMDTIIMACIAVLSTVW